MKVKRITPRVRFHRPGESVSVPVEGGYKRWVCDEPTYTIESRGRVLVVTESDLAQARLDAGESE